MVEMMDDETRELMRKFNRLAEKAGWRPVEKQNRSKAKLTTMIRDLQDYLDWFQKKHGRFPTQEPEVEVLVRKGYR
jgi:hypothetical protein